MMAGFALGVLVTVAVAGGWRLLRWRRYMGWRVRTRPDHRIGEGPVTLVQLYRRFTFQEQTFAIIQIRRGDYAVALDEALANARVLAATMNGNEARARRRLPA